MPDRLRCTEVETFFAISVFENGNPWTTWGQGRAVVVAVWWQYLQETVHQRRGDQPGLWQ